MEGRTLLSLASVPANETAEIHHKVLVAGVLIVVVTYLEVDNDQDDEDSRDQL